MFQEKLFSCLLWGHSKSTFAQRGGGGGVDQKRTKTNRGGVLLPLRTFAFQKIVWPILFTLAIVIELFSSLLHFFFLLVSSCFFCLVVSFCKYVYLSTFLEGGGGGGGCQNKKISVRTGGGGGGCPKTNKGEQGGGGGGSKIAKFERTYFLNAP